MHSFPRSWRAAAAPLLLAALLTSSGCYTTRLYEPGADPRLDTRERHTSRQWFVAGLVPLSDPGGTECDQGIAWSTSGTSAIDLLFRFGVGLAAGLAVGLAGDYDTQAEQSNAVSGVSFLTSLLVGPQTVEYVCRGPRPAPLAPEEEEDE